MMKAESFNWQRTGKICSGIKDFGLLREKCAAAAAANADDDDDDNKPNFSSIYFSRTVFVIGVIAGITFIMCLVLADKYQKSVNLSHHYASFVYERGREKLHAFNSTSEGDHRDENTSHAVATAKVDDSGSGSGFGRIQNISNKLPIEEINHLLPVTTVLRSLNLSRNGKQLVSFGDFNFSRTEHSQNFTAKPPKKAVHGLADLLRRTELKPIPVEKATTVVTDAPSSTVRVSSPTTTTESSLRFAQLESYRHHRTVKNLQDLLKYINCNSATNCGLRYQPQVTTESTPVFPAAAEQTPPPPPPPVFYHENLHHRVGDHHQHRSTPSYPRDKQRIQISVEPASNADFNISSADASGSDGNDMLYADTNAAPFYYTSYSADLPDRTITSDRFHGYRAASPLEINQLQLEQTENAAAAATTAEQIFHRFSNRMYHSRGMAGLGSIENDNVDVRTQVLESYLKPPTPPPTTLSFTPSYTTAVFHGFNELNANENDLRPEATAVESSMTQIKPISLMVEIFPANDYELPGSLFGDNRYSGQHEPNQMNNPSSPPWKLTTPISQNKMRLFVNLFPQQ